MRIVLVMNNTWCCRFIKCKGDFVAGETITGGTSTSVIQSDVSVGLKGVEVLICLMQNKLVWQVQHLLLIHH